MCSRCGEVFRVCIAYYFGMWKGAPKVPGAEGAVGGLE